MIRGRLSFTLTLTLLFGFGLPFFLPPVSAQQCSRCNAPPTADCRIRDLSPADGGTPCSCVSTAILRGCTLKPCAGLPPTEVCDLSGESGSMVDPRAVSYKYQCTGARGECETCHSAPPDCTQESLSHPPFLGGPDCSCGTVTVGGCTLKPCKSQGLPPIPCICQPGISATVCFHSNCPGNGGGSGGGARVAMSARALSSCLFILITSILM